MLGVVESHRAGQRFEHALGHAAHLSALEPVQVGLFLPQRARRSRAARAHGIARPLRVASFRWVPSVRRSEEAVAGGDSEPIGSAPRPRRTTRLTELAHSLRDFGRRRRTPITVVGSLATAAILALVLAGRQHEFEAALFSAAAWVLAVTVGLQIVALLARSEAWHLTIQEAGRGGASSIARRACRSWAACSTRSWGWPRGSPHCGAPRPRSAHGRRR